MIDLEENVNLREPLLTNLSFDHPLTNQELGELINLLSNSFNISQIYFKDDCDLITIEKVKTILEAMPNIEDETIDKYILKELSPSEEIELANMNFININSWNIAYDKEGNCNLITSLSKYRKINEWFNEVMLNIDNDLSVLEKVCYIYDRVKLLDYDDSDKYQRMPDIITSLKANSYGYNIVFNKLLSKLGIKSSVEKISINNEDNFITIAIINDKKYNVDGVYVFEPSSDTISKDKYKNSWARRMNYNFFALSMDKLKNLGNEVKFHGIIKLLSSYNYDEFDKYLRFHEQKYGNIFIVPFENSMGLSIREIYDKNKETQDLDEKTLLNIITKRLSINGIMDNKSYIDMVSDNYQARNKELFKTRM